MKDEREDKMKDEREDKMKDERQDERRETRQEPMVQMTTPHVALNCLITRPPSGN